MPRPVAHNRIQIKERREDVLTLLTKGMKGYEIAKVLGVIGNPFSRRNSKMPRLSRSQPLGPLCVVLLFYY
jgi:hypothetical protein